MVATLATLMLFTGATGAGASATGQVLFSSASFSVGTKSFYVPAGTLTHSISGSGRTANGESAVAANLATICYGRLDWVTLGDGDKFLSRTASGSLASCVVYLTRQRSNYTFASNVKKGCVDLYINSVYKARQCHNIM
ncbi:hypothetical protein N868_15555 [Cellulomonas carbonis T26]|uniref:Uncharacterized protein n=1 Tax=Cellulomonas carbonis T26 TaxID=947969 RepID=A0A0A0BR02_9CELL|nr:hypothetical protein N868_15555 [Cellulomonas carbonis T26]